MKPETQQKLEKFRELERQNIQKLISNASDFAQVQQDLKDRVEEALRLDQLLVQQEAQEVAKKAEGAPIEEKK